MGGCGQAAQLACLGCIRGAPRPIGPKQVPDGIFFEQILQLIIHPPACQEHQRVLHAGIRINVRADVDALQHLDDLQDRDLVNGLL